VRRELEEEFKEALRTEAVVELLEKGSIAETEEKIIDIRKMQ